MDEMSFLFRVVGLSLRVSIWEKLKVELRLLCIERSQFGQQFGHLAKMPPWRDVPGVFTWEDIPRQDTLQRLYLS